jgi:hypothetical protein
MGHTLPYEKHKIPLRQPQHIRLYFILSIQYPISINQQPTIHLHQIINYETCLLRLIGPARELSTSNQPQQYLRFHQESNIRLSIVTIQQQIQPR